jgi:Domain of unknown function (DUF4367)
MMERLGLATVSDLEAALADLGTAVELPPTPDLASAVGARLRVEPATRSQPGRRWRPVRRSLLLAAALLLLAAGVAVGIRVGLDLLSIDFGPVPTPIATPVPSASPSDASMPGDSLTIGDQTTLGEARAAADFPVLVPAELGDPDAVLVGGPRLRGQVAFVYGPRPDLPASDSLDGAGLLITQNRGTADDGLARKLVDARIANVAAVEVDGAPGYWISGEPHFFWYLAPDGSVIEDSRRFVGDTLVWERDGILYRLEGELTKERALEIAESMR